MDISDKFTGILTKYKGKKVRVVFNNEASWFHDKCEGIVGDVFSDGFFIDVGKKSPEIRICYLRNIQYVKLLE
jgi:hypothetical protein